LINWPTFSLKGKSPKLFDWRISSTRLSLLGIRADLVRASIASFQMLEQGLHFGALELARLDLAQMRYVGTGQDIRP